MLQTLIRIVLAPWVLAMSLVSAIYGSLVPSPPARIQLEDNEKRPVVKFPTVSRLQKQQLVDRFTEAIDPQAVASLASRYNGGKPCKVTGRSSGSYNLCFFVDFEDGSARWVVRIPIEPQVHDPWTKLLSEVATIRQVPHQRVEKLTCSV